MKTSAYRSNVIAVLAWGLEIWVDRAGTNISSSPSIPVLRLRAHVSKGWDGLEAFSDIWVVVKIMVPFWVP